MSAHLASADLLTGWPKQQTSLSAIFEIFQIKQIVYQFLKIGRVPCLFTINPFSSISDKINII